MRHPKLTAAAPHKKLPHPQSIENLLRLESETACVPKAMHCRDWKNNMGGIGHGQTFTLSLGDEFGHSRASLRGYD